MSRRPDWAATSTYALAWRTAVAYREAAHQRQQSWTRSFSEGVLGSLARARVVVVAREQVEALPELPDEVAAEILIRERLCFDPLYIDMSFAREARLVRSSQSGATYLGVLFVGDSGVAHFDSPGLVGFGAFDAVPFMTPFAVGASQTPEGPLLSNVTPPRREPLRVNGVTAGQDALEGVTRLVSDIGARFLQFLAAYNVELVEASISRQERRAIQRRAGRIALAVRVRVPHRSPSRATAAKANFTHRFEVRGHYKHFPAGTRLADSAPEKLSWEPKRQQYVRRVWCPPFVKGPEDKPLIPKLRVIAPVR